MNDSICPICGQVGLPDYKIQRITCPQCNSDLIAYFLLNSVQKRKNRNKFNVALLSFFGISIFLFMIFIFYNIRTHNQVLLNYGKQINTLEDSLSNYRNQKSIVSNNLKNEQIFTYRVRKGDSPWKIAVIFYGNGLKFKLVEQENNLIEPYKLKAGQLIKIKSNR